jgi:serine/threonine-protein kinase
MVGTTIGKYHVLDRVGRGGMGTVYRALDETLHREVAIKVLNSELNDPEVAKRFRAEAVTVARLSHPGIATIYELFQHDGQWMMVMEFVRGETLEHLVERMGALSPQRAAELCMQALTALAHAHSMGVIHRDLKPANLMMTESGAVKIMDFGIARVSGSEHLTSAGFMMGTPAYMAPEQVLGHEIDARADLYAMGVVFYRLTTAKLPFKGDTPFAMAQSQVNDPPTPLGMLRADLPMWTDQVVTRALAKNPNDRFQSAVEFYESFSRCLAGLPMTGAYNPSGPTELLHTPARPMPTAATPQPTWPGHSSGSIPAGGHSLPPAYGGETASRVTQSGRTAQQPVPPPTGGAPVVAPPPPAVPTSSAKPLKSSAAKSGGSNTLSMALGAMVVVLGTILIVMWVRSHRQQAVPVSNEAATPAATATPTPTPTDTPATTPTADASVPPAPSLTASTAIPPPASPSPATPPPNATTSSPSPTPATTPAAKPPATPKPPSDAGSTSRGSTTGASPPTTPASRADTRGATPPSRGTPTPTPTASASPTPSPTPPPDTGRAATTPTPTPTPVPEENLTFQDVKLLSISGTKATDQDVLLSFVSGQIHLTGKGGGSSIMTLAYKTLAHATYVHAKDPKWDATLPAPPGDKLDMPGLIHPSRHWLTLQTHSGYVILRLDDNNWERILQAVESRTGQKVDRVSDKEIP